MMKSTQAVRLATASIAIGLRQIYARWWFLRSSGHTEQTCACTKSKFGPKIERQASEPQYSEQRRSWINPAAQLTLSDLRNAVVS